jgi:hypothetical protein
MVSAVVRRASGSGFIGSPFDVIDDRRQEKHEPQKTRDADDEDLLRKRHFVVLVGDFWQLDD